MSWKLYLYRPFSKFFKVFKFKGFVFKLWEVSVTIFNVEFHSSHLIASLFSALPLYFNSLALHLHSKVRFYFFVFPSIATSTAKTWTWLETRNIHNIRVWLLSPTTKHLLGAHIAVLCPAGAGTVRAWLLSILRVAPRASATCLPILDGLVDSTLRLRSTFVAVVAHAVHDSESWVGHFSPPSDQSFGATQPTYKQP